MKPYLLILLSVCFSYIPLYSQENEIKLTLMGKHPHSEFNPPLKITPIKSRLYLLNSEPLNVFKKSKKLWDFEDMASEYFMGTAIGAGFALIGGALGSLGHVAGDTSSSSSNTTRNIVLALMAAGHAIGVPYGIVKAGNDVRADGSLGFTIIGTLIGEAAGIYMMTRDKKWMNWVGGGIMLLISPLLGTLGFNTGL